jgi:hypothetical protein
MATIAEPVGRDGSYELGVGRPPLRLDDLPEPEAVFGVPRISGRETITHVIGPSLIALGLSIGSGEWLLGPLAIGTEGWIGIGFVILVSILLQAFYNVEIGRYVMATGEVPSIGFGRIPPGFLVGTVLAVALFYLAFITGGWASGAGDGLFTFIHGDPPASDADKTQSHWLAVALMAVVFVITLLGRKISRTLELVNWGLVAVILVSLLIIDLILVSGSEWLDGVEGLVRPALPPEGTDATLIGSVAGFAAMASGLNYVFMNYYRDKGYGMGSRSGYIPGLLERNPQPVEPLGTTFRDTPENDRRWSRWYRFLVLEMWVVFVPGAVLGMLFPGILVKSLADETGTAPTKETMPTYVADQIKDTGHSDVLFYWTLLVGFLILFTTQLVVFEMLVRNFVDAAYGASARFRQLVGGDPRRFYYPFMILLAGVISLIIFSNPATTLVQWSANMSNLAALIFPFAILYLNSKLPRVARTRWWGYPILLLAVIFFGFFFLNFAYAQITDEALVTF